MKEPVKYYINPYIMYLSRLLRCRFREALNKEGLFVGQHELLVTLYHNPGTSASRLAKELDLSLATVSVSIKRLEEAGFVTKVKDEKDSRTTWLYLSDKGRDVHDSIRATIIQTEETLVQGMTPEEINLFRDYLKKAITNLGGSDRLDEAMPLFCHKFSDEIAPMERRQIHR